MRMYNKILFVLLLLISISVDSFGSRREFLLRDSWQFCKGEESPQAKWKAVSVPHDWAIYGPFDRKNDLQYVVVTQNLETEKSYKTGRTGGLPYEGVGVYRTEFEVADTNDKSISLVFDGAMSEAHIYVNDKEVCYWPYGYNSFHCNIDSVVKPGKNKLQVHLENFEESSRWYSGAGLYRNVHLIVTDKVHVPVWGTYITTPYVSEEYSTVNLITKLEGVNTGDYITLETNIKDDNNVTVASSNKIYKVFEDVPFTQAFTVNAPRLWSPETPNLYIAETKVLKDGKVVDTYNTRFGIRSIELRAGKGFFLNGKMRKIQGVCNHHDLGPLGAAVNKSAIRHQLELLKDMGCDAIRTSHNMPAPELVELCDEMGFMMMVEPFDDWNFSPKCKNDYNRLFNDWAEKDMINMIHHYRNNASVIMWSIGNEVPNQYSETGIREATFLQDICHREDPTRPVTCGMDHFDAVVNNGFGAVLDIAGFNYKPKRYPEANKLLPQNLLMGSETASTVSSRGVYKFPVAFNHSMMYDDHQCSSYDNEYCSWSNIPDIDFAADEDLEYNIGQFVWTGFDYLGEPSPYDTDAWPNHSSMFGIIDLASIPKDRFYLYRSLWNKSEPTLHILPHWNWAGREGEITPVFVYTSYPKAELFINGVSKGVREKNDSTIVNRYRLMWNEVKYEPGEVKVVAYDKDNKAMMSKVVKTAGKAHHLVLSTNKSSMTADGEDLVYITVQMADKDGNIIVPDNRLVKFKVSGNGSFRATANGDATCLYPFQNPEMPLFSGALTAIVQSSEEAGAITFEAGAKGVKSAKITITTK
ncbi:MAG: glycoside hydrolase family 2 TIM barrel-domain containing protein [Muribaculaceae bacterium]|nr:glycoside hydrolase family 2 TIM barrel-domain containing protein [Muribaculaceae bacterium]